MALQLAQPVIYQVPAEHTFLYPEAQLAGMVTRVNADNSADLVVFPPQGIPVAVNSVPEGVGPGTAQIPAIST